MPSKMPCFVFDSYPLISVALEDPGYEQIVEMLKTAARDEVRLFISAINLGEIYYIIARRKGEEKANAALVLIENLHLQIIDATWMRILAAARIKARYPVSYANAFAIVAAQELSCPVVTGDPEFQRVAHLVEVMWMSNERRA